MATYTHETNEQVIARVEQQKAAKRAELERTLAPLREKTAAEQAAKAKAKADAEQAAQEKQRAEAAARFDAEHKTAAKAAWLANGGTPAEFDSAWPEMRQSLLVEATQQAAKRARAATAATYRQQF